MIRLVPVATVLAADTESGVRPAAKINPEDETQRNYWAYRLSVSSDDLNAAIEAVGPSVAAIRRHLGK
ncbi:DUF3606 domain-containing protein [Tardiphaga alba]|uniref:DUF3606 domain-containing protein n=1 Tax=Tardiphaga alba TaxID=340268 RepID=A0ABX8AC66_9BRAD|nr:DUF3606 domain-containing protein [Tardiphaga alba]QUS39915.1 DUF3606 domain-containing protein [Tardiphaga alba]